MSRRTLRPRTALCLHGPMALSHWNFGRIRVEIDPSLPEQAHRVIETYTQPVQLRVPPSLALASLRGSS